jgi:hypothetical protein
MPKTAPFLALTLLLGGCVTPLPPVVAPQGSAVPLDQPVHVGRLAATPRAIIEDSRCPENARCVWAGRLVVSTRIDGENWHETVRLTLGERYATHGTWITLVSGLPEKQAEQPTPPRSYRLAYEGGV